VARVKSDSLLVKLVATLRAQAEKAKLAQAAAKEKQQAAVKRASDMLDKARHEQKSGRIHEALAVVKQGLEIAPHHAGLLDLQKELNSALARATQITSLLAQCEKHLREGRLTTGNGGNAYDCYRSVIELQATNQAALDGLRKIADKYASWAINALDGKNLSRANVYLDRLRTVDPQHPQLASLRNRAERLEREQQEWARAHRQPSPSRKRQSTAVAKQAVAPPREEGTDSPLPRPAPQPEQKPPSSSESPKRSRIWGTF
jgi:hypothetical protein